MTLQELLNQASEYLKERNVEDPSKEAGLLLSWVLGKDLSKIYAHPGLIPEDKQIREFRSAVERRGRHEPFAYITGQCEFLSLSFEVNPHVLIPRPDTEILAEAALFALGQAASFFNQTMFRLSEKESYRVLDIGTGSGCLAVSIAKNARSVRVDALDISKDAIETAKRNAAKHYVIDRISFIQADFLSEITIGKYDLIISNPPYIPMTDISGLMVSVRDYEPYTALAGGEDGLLFYRALAEKAESILAPQGIIAVECGYNQAMQIQNLFQEKGMDALSLKDLSGIDRVVTARIHC